MRTPVCKGPGFRLMHPHSSPVSGVGGKEECIFLPDEVNQGPVLCDQLLEDSPCLKNTYLMIAPR